MNNDELQWAIWTAIRDAVTKLEFRYKISMKLAENQEYFSYNGMAVPVVETWKLVEVLSLLMILLNADNVLAKNIGSIFGKIGPVRIIEDGKEQFLWSQSLMRANKSELGGRPDLIVTSSEEWPGQTNVQRVVECKAHQRLGTRTIRQEFGKAFDLMVRSYLIWSLNTPSNRIIEGAKRLGLDLVSLGFDTPRRIEFVKKPELLSEFISEKIEESKRNRQFAQMLSGYMMLAGPKMIEG
jgi:hypothetical protein